MDREQLAKRWRVSSLRYAAQTNQWIERSQTGEQAAGAEPEDDREPMAGEVLQLLREANLAGTVAMLRQEFPPAWEPFIAMLDANGQALSQVEWGDDASILVRIGPDYELGRVVLVGPDGVTHKEVITGFGASRDHKFFAYATKRGVDVHAGWQGPVLRSLPWPASDPSHRQPTPPMVTSLTVFPDGSRVLLVSPSGVFVLSDNGAARLLLTDQELIERQEYDGGSDVSMAHGAISPDGKLIVVGHQDSAHLIFDAELKPVGRVGPHGEYPHFAWFSADGDMVALNACHLYSGTSIGVHVSALRGIATDSYDEHPSIRTLEDGARVYAAVSRTGETIIGDAHGYLRAFDWNGQPLWRHFLGSTICAASLSPDQRRLAVSTYAGILHVLDLDAGEHDPFAIGNSSIRELYRWIFWKEEARPLKW